MSRRNVWAAAIMMALLALSITAACGGGEEPAPAEGEQTAEDAEGAAGEDAGETAETEVEPTEQTEQEPQMVTASHILIAYQGAARATATRSQEDARQLVDELSGKIAADSISFEQAAIDYSDCPSGAQGGDLGSFGRGSMVPAFEEATFALEPGEVSGVVETEFGYHLIKRTE